MDQLRESEDRQVVAEQAFKNEMTSQKKLCELYQGKTNEFSLHNQELEGLVGELEGQLNQLSSQLKERESRYESALEEQIKIQHDLDVQVEQLGSQLKLVNAELMHGTRADQIAHLSVTASAASRVSKSGKSFTQIYSDYTNLQQELIKEKSEVARLNELVQHIVGEFEQRAPLIQKTNEDYQKARKQIELMSLQLSGAVREKREALTQLESIKTTCLSLESQQKLLEKEIEDRNRQLQAVLREQEIIKGVHPSTLLSEETLDDSSLQGADAIISKRLVVYKNIEELQNQNHALLRSIRSLSAKMEAQEESTYAQADEARIAALNESTRLIEKLEEQVKREALNSESYIKERDQWRRIAESRTNRSVQGSPELLVGAGEPVTPTSVRTSGSPDYEGFYRELQREFDVYRKESGTDTKLLKAQLELVQQEKTELTIQVAKLNNQIDYLNDRHELLIQSSQAKEKEVEQVRERLSLINQTATRQDIKIEELSNAVIQARQNLECCMGENQNLKVEKQIWKASEQRMVKESQDVLKERNLANDRIRELQDHLDERDRKSGIKMRKMEEQLEEMNRDLQLSRKQLADVIDDHRTLTSKRDAELRESQIKMERLTVDFERAKGELMLVQNKEQNSSSKVVELTAKIAALEQQAVRPRQALESMSMGSSSIDPNPLFDIESELRQVKIELEAAKASLVVAEEKAETFQAISQAAEDRLAEMNATYDIYKSEMDVKIADQTGAIEKLEADKMDIQDKLTKLGETLTETQEKMDSEIDQFNSAKVLYERRMETLKENEEQSMKSVAAMKQDLSRQVKIAQDSQQNYEREVVLHSTALQSARALKTANEELVQLRDDAMQAMHTASEKANSLQNSFDSTKTRLEHEISELERRVEDLKSQNDLLHSQFEQLSISKSQFADVENVPEEGSVISPKALADLGEVIKFLRREKEIVETKLQISLQESERSRLQLEHLQKSLDESRAVLDEERKKSQDFLGSERKHKELLEKIEQTNILRESNITLRSQLESSQQKIDQLDQKFKRTEVLIEPLKCIFV
jgi:nucleoprotein TPR